MGKIIENLKWEPLWISHLGCIMGCLDYLNRDVSKAWIVGGTGHAFIINMHSVVCPSGPTAWRKERFYRLIDNLGCTSRTIVGVKTEKNFTEKQQQIWDTVREFIDTGLPCYGWELDIPEFYVVNGYDETGYLYSGAMCRDGKGPKPWNELGVSEIGVLEMNFVKASPPLDDISIVKDALTFAVEFSSSPGAWLFPDYSAGLDGFDSWMNALRNNQAHDWGMAYNSAVWYECRALGTKFLIEAHDRIGGDCAPLFKEAAEHYRRVSLPLKELTELFPFPPKDELKDEEKRQKGVELIKSARVYEEKGLNTLVKIIEKLA